MPFVTLKRPKQIRRLGEHINYRPGDTVEVGRQTAIEWILDGTAEDPFEQIGPPVVPLGPKSDKFGIRIRAPEGGVYLSSSMKEMEDRLMISYGPPAIPYAHTLIWNPRRRLHWKMANYGFQRILEQVGLSWELAAGLVSVSMLAKDFGSEEERDKTEKAIGDLRLPMYDPCYIWARQCKAAHRVIKAWADELAEGADETHAFLRALYTQRAMLCTLPVDWMPR